MIGAALERTIEVIENVEGLVTERVRTALIASATDSDAQTRLVDEPIHIGLLLPVKGLRYCLKGWAWILR